MPKWESLPKPIASVPSDCVRINFSAPNFVDVNHTVWWFNILIVTWLSVHFIYGLVSDQFRPRFDMKLLSKGDFSALFIAGFPSRARHAWHIVVGVNETRAPSWDSAISIILDLLARWIPIMKMGQKKKKPKWVPFFSPLIRRSTVLLLLFSNREMPTDCPCILGCTICIKNSRKHPTS